MRWFWARGGGTGCGALNFWGLLQNPTTEGGENPFSALPTNPYYPNPPWAPPTCPHPKWNRCFIGICRNRLCCDTHTHTHTHTFAAPTKGAAPCTTPTGPKPAHTDPVTYPLYLPLARVGKLDVVSPPNPPSRRRNRRSFSRVESGRVGLFVW